MFFCKLLLDSNMRVNQINIEQHNIRYEWFVGVVVQVAVLHMEG